jgi:hypothetical protein
MNKRLSLLISAAALSTAAASAPTNLQAATSALSTNAAAPAKHSYIVTLRREADQDGCVNEHKIKRGRSFRHAINGFEAELDDAAVARLKRDGRVRAVEKNGQMAPCLLQFPQQTPAGVARIGILQFPMTYISNGTWNNQIDVDVAVLDTGIDPTHPDLNVVQIAGFAEAGLSGYDWNGHGTSVAGTLGARDNAFGVFGTAPGVRLWSVQVLGRTSTAWDNFIAGCEYIIQHADRISVVNASMGPAFGTTTLPYAAMHEAVSNVVSKGIVFVAAAGNYGQDLAGVDGVWGYNPTNGLCDDNVPAAFPEVMAVSAMDPVSNVIASFSNSSRINKVPRYVISSGLGIDVAAPGVNIYSTWLASSNGYTFMSGTSSASPHVAGLVALYIAMHGRATNAAGVYAIRQAIVDAAIPQANSGWSVADTGDPDGNPEPLAFANPSLVPPSNILSCGIVNRAVHLNFAAVPGYVYTAQYSDSLGASAQWTNLPGAVTGMGKVSTAILTDTNPHPAMRFYRIAAALAAGYIYSKPAATNAGSIGPAANAFGEALLGDPGVVGASFRFSCFMVSKYQVPYLPALNPNGPFTVEFWARPTQLAAASPLVSVDTSQNAGNSRSGWGFYENSSNWEFQVGGLSGNVATTTGGSVQAFAWHHLAGVYDGTNITLYVNGQPVAGPTDASGFTPNSTAPLRFGRASDPAFWSNYPSSQAYDGWLDEVAIYTNALSADAIAAHYSAAATNNAGYAAQILADQPLGYWHLDEPAP